MPLSKDYVSKIPGPDGLIDYSPTEHDVWRDLYCRQMSALPAHASSVYLDGLLQLGISGAFIPQVPWINERLSSLTGAGVEAVDALIPQDEFSTLLSQRRFPMATFIRKREHFDYIEEPDIFHECFGHCPMLTNDAFCRFLERFGALALELDSSWSERLFRLFWFTVEFGVVRENGLSKPFGAGIMSSPGELAHVISATPEIKPFDLLTVLRTPYRIDIVQPLYFEVESFDKLADSLNCDMEAMLRRAEELGDLPARFDRAAA